MRSEIKIALLGIAALVILIFGYKFLKGQNILEKEQSFYIRYDDVSQLAKSDGVYINGFKVGSVIDIFIDKKDANYVIVKITIDGDLLLPQNTLAVITPNGVLGEKFIGLEFDRLCESNCLEDGSYIKGKMQSILGNMLGEPEDLNAYYTTLKSNLDSNQNVKTSISDLQVTLNNLNQISTKLDALLTNSSNSLTNVFRNLDNVTGEVSRNKKSLGETIKNLEQFSNTLKSAEVDKMVSNVNQAVSSADQTLKKFEGTLAETNTSLKGIQKLVNGLENGEGSMGKLMKDKTLVTNLEKATKNLDLLLQDLRLNPKRYVNVSVFGKRQKEYRVPEDDPAIQK